MKPLLLTSLAALALVADAARAQSQFELGATYLMSALLPLPPNQIYAGIRRVDPYTGATTPLIQFSSNGVYPASAAYDPYRDRIVAFCSLAPSLNPQVHAIDASGNATLVANTYLVRLAPRGDGKIYGYKAGSANPAVQQIFYLDENGQEHTLLDVGGAAPWMYNGGVYVPSLDPIRAMIYEPRENALFLALHGDNGVPDCGAPSFDLSVRKLPLTADGTALRAPAVCAEYDVGGIANVDERPLGFSYGPRGNLVLAVFPNYSGPLPRLLLVDPVTAQISPFATVGPYYGDIGISCAVYHPVTNRALLLDGGNDVFRTFAEGAAGAGQVLASFGPPGLGNGVDTMFVVGPIGTSGTLSADATTLSVAGGGVVNLDYHPGPAFAGGIYLILGSMSGWAPGVPLGGHHLPLNPDWYTNVTFDLMNSQYFANTLGLVPPSGSAAAQLVFPPQLLASLVGQTMHHAAIGFDGALAIVHTSNAVPLHLLP